MSAEEIWEEVICDSMADMNIFEYGSENADTMADVIEEVKEQTRDTEPNGTRGSPSGEVKYSIAKTTDNRPVVEVSPTQFEYKKIDVSNAIDLNDKSARKDTPTDNNISHKQDVVNTYSMQNSENDVKFSRVTEAELLKEEQYGSNRGRDTEGFDRFSRKTEEKNYE